MSPHGGRRDAGLASRLTVILDLAAADARHDRVARASGMLLGGTVAAATGFWLSRRDDAAGRPPGFYAWVLPNIGTVGAIIGAIELFRPTTSEKLAAEHRAAFGRDDSWASRHAQSTLGQAADEDASERFWRFRVAGAALLGIAGSFALAVELDDAFDGQRGQGRLTAAAIGAAGAWGLWLSFSPGPAENALRTWTDHQSAPESPRLLAAPVDRGAVLQLVGSF